MGKVAFLFPGQGSQKVGMGKAFYDAFPQARSVYDHAAQTLGIDIAQLCFDGPEETLRETENAQVALFTTSIAALRCMESVSARKPDAVAGHSVGEYAALVAAGTVEFDEALRLVRRRGELMRDAAARTPGTMLALLGMEAEAARTLCEEVRASGAGLVSVANYNGGGQIVLSGEHAAIEKAGELAKERGAKRVIPLNVSGAFHSPLMVTAGDALFEDIRKANFRKPETSVVLNVTADYAESMDDLMSALTRQVSGSVRWEESVQRLLADGVDTFVELGSGEVLAGLMKRIDKSAKAISVTETETLQTACALLSMPEI